VDVEEGEGGDIHIFIRVSKEIQQCGRRRKWKSSKKNDVCKSDVSYTSLCKSDVSYT